MSRAVTLGNGTILVGLGDRGQVRDLYYPFVGEANHISGASGNFMHRIGVYVDGRLYWLDDPTWRVSVGCAEDAPIGSFFAQNDTIGIELSSTDAVHNEKNIFLRHFVVRNLRPERRTIKVFLSQQFRISESRRGDTGFYDPRVKAIIHYKGHVALLINARTSKKAFQEYNIGLFGIEGREGTFHDAQDGKLERNPIEHGSVDSVVGLEIELAHEEHEDIFYWIACGSSIPETHVLDEHVLTETPERLIASTSAYWQAWLDKEQTNLSLLPKDLQTLYQRSLIVMRVHSDNNGGIIASSDTDMLHHGRDTYSYVWPRDAAMISYAFDSAGYEDVSRRFFEFIARCQEPGGYLMHKYRSDGVLGSSWHPWLIDGVPRLPIQEDEIASVLYALWNHYELNRDIEFIEGHYNSFIEPASEFLVDYIEPTTGLPQPSFDLWEEKYGISTYTAASVYGALMAASKFAMVLGKEAPARTYQAVAQRIQTAIETHLYDATKGIFAKHVLVDEDGMLRFDWTLDASSFHGLLFFGVFDVDDERMSRMSAAVEERLQVAGESKGFVRYEGDAYYRMRDAGSPNPWVVTTMWMARYYIAKAKKITDLKRPLELLIWTGSHATKSGMLAEQMHPDNRQHLSAAPLVWSHAEYVLTVKAYLEKVREFEKK